ncbi:MAG: histidine phosphatase family protein [Patescibacteria group bacterium]
MPIDIVAMRHGESEINLAARRSRHADDSDFTPEFLRRQDAQFRLTDKGVEQVRVASTWIQKHLTAEAPFDAHFVSGFVRARESAAYLDLPGALWEVSPYLHERDWGILTQMTEKGRLEAFRVALQQRHEEPYFFRPHGGERLSDVCVRLEIMRDRFAREYIGKRVLLVAHGEVLWALRILYEDMTPEEFAREHFADGGRAGMKNCQILHYTRRNPHTGDVGLHMEWMRTVAPTVTDVPTSWYRIVRKLRNSEELLADVNLTKRLISR